jgi:hypothetical protein
VAEDEGFADSKVAIATVDIVVHWGRVRVCQAMRVSCSC